MWIETSDGPAFAPSELTLETIAHLPDSAFPDLFQAIDELSSFIESQSAPSILYQLLLRREAQTFGCRLGGSARDDLVYIVSPFIPFHVFDSFEALNFAQAAQHAWSSSANPYLPDQLSALHRLLLPNQDYAGKFRQRIVGMGPRGFALADAAVLLTPSELIGPCLEQLEQFADAIPPTHRIACAAMLHFQFISIHPFIDGNGRVARSLLPSQLRRLDVVDAPVLYLSEALLWNVGEYFTRVESLQKYNEATAWVRFFADIMLRQARSALEFVRLAVYVRTNLIRSLKQAGVIGRLASSFTNESLLSPTFPLSRAEKLLKRDRTDVQRLLGSLDGVYGLTAAVGGDDPIYQFGGLADLFLL